MFIDGTDRMVGHSVRSAMSLLRSEKQMRGFGYKHAAPPELAEAVSAGSEG